jgi:hypothetical protein
VSNEQASTVLAGAAGVAIVFALTLGLGVIARKTRKGGSA